MSIIPKGFEVTAHPIFRTFRPPQFQALVDTNKHIETTQSTNTENNDYSSPVEIIRSQELIDGHNSEVNTVIDLTGDQAIVTHGTESVETVNEEPVANNEDFSIYCPICLETYDDPVTIISCKHHFCYTCIDSWFEINKVCPLCKDKEVFFIKNPSNEIGTHSSITSSVYSKPERKRPRGNQLEIWTYYDPDKDKKKPKIKSSSGKVREAIQNHQKFRENLKEARRKQGREAKAIRARLEVKPDSSIPTGGT